MSKRQTGALIYFVIVMILGSVSKGDTTPRFYCKSGVSKPCGNACIPEYKKCRKSWTTGAIGVGEQSVKKSYDNPTLVTETPKN